ncbi:MAG: LacI family DNA-binding transcriptional regulator [Lentisphaerota bacterium]
MSAVRKKPTIFDVARLARTSSGTVSRVINNRPNVAPSTREEVLEAARKLGFMPQQTTRRINIGVVTRDIEPVHEAGYMGRVLSELINQAAAHDVSLEIVPLKDIQRVYTHYMQGLIGLLYGEAAQVVRKVRHIPVLLINNAGEKSSFLSVASDHAEGARLGAAHLLERGHRRIALVQIEKADWGARERERGFREAFAQAGVPVSEDLIVYLESWSIEEAFDPVLKKNPTAVFVSGEDLSIAIMDALIHRLKIRIPRDLSLLTYEIPLLSSLLTPPMTTIAQPWSEMARLAIRQILLAVRKTAGLSRALMLPNQLIERASVTFNKMTV